MPGPQGGAGWGTEVLGSSPGPWGQSPGPRTRVWDAARAAAAGQAVSAGSREWAAGPLVGVRLPPSTGPRSRLVPAGVLPALATRGGPSSTHGPGSRDRGAVGAASGTTRLPIGKRGPLPTGGWEQPSRPRRSLGLAPQARGRGRGRGRRRTLPQGRGLPGGGGTFGRSPGGEERGAPAVGARPARGAVSISWTQQPWRSRHGPFPLHEEVPLPTSPGAGGADPPRLLGLELRFWVNNGRCTNRY